MTLSTNSIPEVASKTDHCGNAMPSVNLPRVQQALVSVSDKTGIADFCRSLAAEFGVKILSTGGTAEFLKKAGIPVTSVEEVTGFPEMLDGRVKTLHPRIHAAILADRGNPEHLRQLQQQNIQPIDMVVVNLYPFEKTVGDPNCTFEQAVEMIDIGGPCLLRAAAKNHVHVLALSDPCHYRRTLEFLRGNESRCGADWRSWLMTKAIAATAEYDSRIYRYFATKYWETPFTPYLSLDLSMMTPTTANELKYGENPHQRAGIYRVGDRLHGLFGCPSDDSLYDTANSEKMGFNNFADASAGYELCAELNTSMNNSAVVVLIKHTNCCGCGVASDPIEAYRRAYLGDPNAAMGGILACNFIITPPIAEQVMHTYDQWGRQRGAGGFFLEVWVAPAFEKMAVEVIQSRKEWGKRLCLWDVGDMRARTTFNDLDFRPIAGGMLVQTPDDVGLNEAQWKVVTRREPTEAELADLRLAWLIAKHTKSNAISICKDSMLIGNGAGQMSRVMSCRVAAWLAGENGHVDRLSGSAAASDAFFPFSDGPGILMDAGVTAIIQPGGAKRDEETIAECNARNATMIFTGTRHFKH